MVQEKAFKSLNQRLKITSVLWKNLLNKGSFWGSESIRVRKDMGHSPPASSAVKLFYVNEGSNWEGMQMENLWSTNPGWWYVGLRMILTRHIHSKRWFSLLLYCYCLQSLRKILEGTPSRMQKCILQPPFYREVYLQIHKYMEALLSNNGCKVMNTLSELHEAPSVWRDCKTMKLSHSLSS